MLSPSTTVEIYSTNVINIGSVLEYVRARVYHFSPLCKLPPVWFDTLFRRIYTPALSSPYYPSWEDPNGENFKIIYGVLSGGVVGVGRFSW
jgi:hypothetical protein